MTDVEHKEHETASNGRMSRSTRATDPLRNPRRRAMIGRVKRWPFHTVIQRFELKRATGANATERVDWKWRKIIKNDERIDRLIGKDTIKIDHTPMEERKPWNDELAPHWWSRDAEPISAHMICWLARTINELLDRLPLQQESSNADDAEKNNNWKPVQSHTRLKLENPWGIHRLFVSWSSKRMDSDTDVD